MFGPKNLPLIVDLDGTIIFNDSSTTCAKKYLRAAPWAVFSFLAWYIKGIAYLKRQLGLRVTICPQDFEYNQELIEQLQREKKSGRIIVLATGADHETAHGIVDPLGIFDEVIASDGIKNCISEQKALALNAKFGKKQYVYVGNSTQDFAVWADSAHAVAVNAPPNVLAKLTQINVSQTVFSEAH